MECKEVCRVEFLINKIKAAIFKLIKFFIFYLINDKSKKTNNDK